MAQVISCTKEEKEVALLMRRDVEIRNRQQLRVVCENALQGSAMVSWLVSSGRCSNRAKAVQVCQRLLATKLVVAVGALGGETSFRDADAALYRFWCDEPSQGGLLQTVGLPQRRFKLEDLELSVVNEEEEDEEEEALAWSRPSSLDDSDGIDEDDRWEFAAHTSHNSLALDVGLAEDIAACSLAIKRLKRFAGSRLPSRSLELRAAERLRTLRRNVRRVLSRESLGWTRVRMLANGAVVSRRSREPRGHYYTVRTDGIVAGATPADFASDFLNFNNRARWEPSFADGLVVEDGILESEAKVPSTMRGSKQLGLAASIDLDKLDLSGCPEGMSIAYGVTEDPELKRALRNVDPNSATECGRCGSKLTLGSGPAACPTCAVIVCRACRGRLVWDVHRKVELRICRHCYVKNTKVFHPAMREPTTAKLATWWNMADVAGDLRKDSDIRIAALFDSSDCSSSKNTANTQEAKGPLPEVSQPVREASLKWSKCMRCGERVARTVEAIDAHTEACVMGATGDAAVPAIKPATLGGVWRTYSSSGRYPRIIYRTVKLPKSSLFRPRQVCAFQDSFCEEDVVPADDGKTVEADGTVVHPALGTRYVYEISVRHGRVVGERNHVTAEVLLLAHAARPVSQKETELTVVSQVDAGRNSRAPGWMVALVHGEDARFGALAAFESPAAAAAREIAAAAAAVTSRMEKSTSATAEMVGLEDFSLVAVLGRGGFGTVMQVRKKSSGRVFAMKVFKKAELRRRHQVERTRTERGIIQHADHPYIVKLRFAFQTETKLYMVMDFAQGGDFFTFLRRFRCLDEEWARFYLAELALALQHLHDMSVVYRDLKPENVLMDAQGHALLADFGLSRDFGAREPLPRDRFVLFDEKASSSTTLAASRSYCGTEQYMAPEMLLQRGHTRAIDWWGLGLFAHETMGNRHPFQGATHADTLRNMVSADPDVDAMLSPAADSLVRRLLVKRADDRLGTERGVRDLAKHAFFFEKIDWDKLAARQLPAPYVPDLRSDLDTSNFDDEFTREAPRDSELRDRKATGFKDGNSFFFDLFTLNFNKNKPAGNCSKSHASDDTSARTNDFENFSYCETALPGV